MFWPLLIPILVRFSCRLSCVFRAFHRLPCFVTFTIGFSNENLIMACRYHNLHVTAKWIVRGYAKYTGDPEASVTKGKASRKRIETVRTCVIHLTRKSLFSVWSVWINSDNKECLFRNINTQVHVSSNQFGVPFFRNISCLIRWLFSMYRYS